MNPAERKQFITQHLDKIRERLLLLADHMPDTWDEARVLAAIEFEVRAVSPWGYNRGFSDARTVPGRRFYSELQALAEITPKKASQP